MFSSCCNNADYPKNTNNTDPVSSNKVRFEYDKVRFDNNIIFVYDSKTDLTIKSFDGLSTITDLNITCPMQAIHQNGDYYYTVYSLKENKLAYVLFQFSPYSGVAFYIKDIIVYPSENANEQLLFLLGKDLPTNILK